MKEESHDIQSTREEKNVTPCDRFHNTIEFIGKRWMGIIIYRLLKGPKRYHQLLREIDGISDRLLTERLRELERHGLIVKHVFKAPSRKVEYELTPKGADLESIIKAILVWVEKYNCHTYEEKQ